MNIIFLTNHLLLIHLNLKILITFYNKLNYLFYIHHNLKTILRTIIIYHIQPILNPIFENIYWNFTFSMIH